MGHPRQASPTEPPLLKNAEETPGRFKPPTVAGMQVTETMELKMSPKAGLGERRGRNVPKLRHDTCGAPSEARVVRNVAVPFLDEVPEPGLVHGR